MPASFFHSLTCHSVLTTMPSLNSSLFTSSLTCAMFTPSYFPPNAPAIEGGVT